MSMPRATEQPRKRRYVLWARWMPVVVGTVVELLSLRLNIPYWGAVLVAIGTVGVAKLAA